MSKKIHCKTCCKYLGEIRDATLSKGLVTVCGECYAQNGNVHDNHVDGGYNRGNTSTPDFMKDLFKGFG